MKPSEYLEKNKIVTGKKPVGTWVFINRMDKQFFHKDELIDIIYKIYQSRILEDGINNINVAKFILGIKYYLETQHLPKYMCSLDEVKRMIVNSKTDEERKDWIEHLNMRLKEKEE